MKNYALFQFENFNFQFFPKVLLRFGVVAAQHQTLANLTKTLAKKSKIKISYRIKAYFFGYLAAFTQWFKLDHNIIPTMGLTTFAGPSNLVGFIERPLGFYDSSVIAIGVSTNIFTALRGLITDFSIVGTIMIIFTSGFLAQLAFNHSRNGSQLALIPLSVFYAFTFYSPLISIFHYNSIILSWIIALLVFSSSRNARLAYNS